MLPGNRLNSFSTTFIFPIGETLGGANIWSARMCGHLASIGHPVAAVVHANPGWHPDAQLPMPGSIRRFSCGGPPVTEAKRSDLAAFAEVYGKTLPAMMVPNWNDVTYAVCAVLAQTRAEDIRVLGVAHGNNESYYGTLTRYEPIIHAFIGVSDEIAAELMRRLPHRKADIYTRACPVDVPEVLDRAVTDRDQPLTITYVGRLTNHEKKVSNLAPLMAELSRLGVDYRFRIIGEGGYRATLMHEISCLPLEAQARVTVEGALAPDQIATVWQATDVCVLVSDSEGTSISMLEAMSAGCVPVVTRVSGVAAVIEEGVNGFVVDRGDMPAMARVIANLARDRSRLSTVGRTAHARVLADYSYEHYVPWFMELSRRLAQAPARRWPADQPLLPPGPGFAKMAWNRAKNMLHYLLNRS